MSDDPSDDVVSTTGFTQSSPGGRRSRKAGQQGILPIGFVLNGIYEVKRFIARGGMGEVYEGVNVNAEERVAVKVILPHLAADPKVQALFRKEAKTLISLAHPALVQYRVLAREPRKDLLYIVTDFIDGEPLTQLIGKGPPLTTAELAMLTRRLAEGLSAAHGHGAIHRDISPENILLPDGVLNRAKIIDFGIAKSMEIGAQTVVGDGFAGKLGYVAPEQFGDFERRIGPWTDIYSLGLVVLALAGGRAPDMGATLVEAIDRRRAGADITVAPAALQPLLGRMLSPDPRNRPQTMGEVIAALDALDLPYEPVSSSWTATNAPTAPASPEAERTVVHFGSEPPSWLSAEPRAATEPPVTEPEPGTDTPEAQTVFAPAVEAEPEPEPILEPEAEETPPPSLPGPEEVPVEHRTVFAPHIAREPEPESEAETVAEVHDPATPAVVDARAPSEPATSAFVPEEDDRPAAPPAMDVAYGSPSVDKDPETATPAPPAPRRPLNGKLIAAGAVAAVVVAGGGFAILSSQHKPALPPQSAQAPVAPAPPGVVHAERAIAAALPSVPCSWLTVGHAQAADGSTSIQISGAAGDPVAVNRAVAAAARQASASGLQVDTTGVLTADQTACPLLDAARGARDQKAVAAPPVVALQSRFEIDRGIQGCPKGLWAQPVINIAPDPSKGFSLIAIQPSGRLEQFAASREQFNSLASRNPGLYQDLGDGRRRVSMCLADAGLAGILMIEGAGPFDIGLRPGAAVRPPRDFAQRLGQLAKDKGWTMQMAWFQLANDQPDQPDRPDADQAALQAKKLADAAQKAAAEAATNAAAPVVTAPVAEPEKLPADYVACRRYVGGAWEELGYASRAVCVERVFAGRCDVQVGRSGDIELRRSGDRLQAKTGKGFRKWQNVGESTCKG